MSANENEDFVLGEDVTALAKSKSRGGTAVVAVRLSRDEMFQVEAICRDTGKTISHVLRDAVRNWLHFDRSSQPTWSLTYEGGPTTTSGSLGASGHARVAENFLPEQARAGEKVA